MKIKGGFVDFTPEICVRKLLNIQIVHKSLRIGLIDYDFLFFIRVCFFFLDLKLTLYYLVINFIIR